MALIGTNIGSGQRPFHSTEGIRWINIDSQEKWHPDIVADGTRTGLEPESVDYAVLHHTIEHFGCGEALGLVKECHRILKPGGSLLVSVPDMRALAQRWLNGQIAEFIFMVNTYGAYMGSEDDRHKWGFTFASLMKQLSEAAPWRTIHRFDNRPIEGADVANDWWILSIEAVK